ncbi:hypothetical protein K474DRAFT_1479839 [Panus rudis PR-1116 ss-1]|nr:hypothetical protein K474DRAFT_1479839 [Panus rudis PR-1116 ss-1]
MNLVSVVHFVSALHPLRTEYPDIKRYPANMCLYFRALRRYRCEHLWEYNRLLMDCGSDTCTRSRYHNPDHDCAQRGCKSELGEDKASILQELPERWCQRCAPLSNGHAHASSEELEGIYENEVEFRGDVPLLLLESH